ncbi:MAG: hypothetical protein WKG52_10150 [Variovorax sp.]
MIALIGADTGATAELTQALDERLSSRGMPVKLVSDPRDCSFALLVAGAEACIETEALRASLMRANLPFAVVYGEPPDRFVNAWNAVLQMADPEAGADGAKPWMWGCDKCSDAACEHRLFSDLVAGSR